MRRFPLEQAPEAFKALLSRQVIGKILLVPDTGSQSKLTTPLSIQQHKLRSTNLLDYHKVTRLPDEWHAPVTLLTLLS